MLRFLVAIHHPDDYEPLIAEDEAMHQAIEAPNDEMVTVGVRVFVGGLHAAWAAKSIRATRDGEVMVSDGPLPTAEHVGGFWVLETADLEVAVARGRKAAVACRAAVEVRQLH